MCYRDGMGVEQNIKRAFELFQQAAEAGDVDAQYCLGQAYENGQGVAQSDQLAEEWYAKGAAAGDSDAQEILDILRKRTHG